MSNDRQPKTHTSIVRRKRPDGTYYVQRITSVYKPKIQNNSVIKSESLGILLARIIRWHWSIENNLHWVLDVVFRQDEMQCRNSDYLTGRTLINKVILNLTSKLQIAEEKTAGKASVSKPAMKAMLSAPEQAIALLTGLYRKNL